MTACAPSWFSETVRRAEKMRDQVGVVLVANVEGRTKPLDDYETDSIVTEFLSNAELDEFVDSFETAGIYCKVVLDEEGFLRWLDKDRSRFGRAIPLVYNLAQNGTGPARLSLVPGLCRLHRLQLLDSDGYAVAIAQHKYHCISLLRQFGLPVAQSWWFTDRGWWPASPPDGLKMIAKPSYDSASIGIHAENIFTMRDGAQGQLEIWMSRYRQPLTVQEFIPGFEVEVPVFEAKEPETILSVGLALNRGRNLGDRILVYDDVWDDGYDFYDFAEENESAASQLRVIASKAFSGLGLRGVGRVDFRVQDNGTASIIEVACKPHLTHHSSFMRAVAGVGGTHADLLKFLVGSAIRRFPANLPTKTGRR
jgi:D-alanine-D-alanine ligase